jgi:hypothetical protein
MRARSRLVVEVSRVVSDQHAWSCQLVIREKVRPALMLVGIKKTGRDGLPPSRA